MGLRERNAATTREHILDTALPMFLDQGYEVTRMEEIAARADIGTSTLYRYFPTKDALVLDPLSIRGHMADEFRSRPTDEPLDLALGHALQALLTAPRDGLDRIRQIRAVLKATPSLRIRLLKEFVQERALLEQAIAERLNRPADDLFCVVTARLATVVLELVAGLGRDDSAADAETATQVTLERARTMMAQLQKEPPVIPRIQAD